MDDENHPTGAAADLELAASKRAAQLAQLVAYSGDGIVSLAPDGVITSANRAACEMFGYTENELVGQPGSIFTPPGQERASSEYRAVVAANASWRGELLRKRKDGSILAVLATVSPVLDEHGTNVGISAFLRDITGQRALENELRRATDRFRQAFVHAPIGMALVDVEGHCLQANAALCTLLGYTEEQLRTMTFRDFTHPDDLSADETLLGELVAGNRQTYQLEKRYLRPGGEVVWARLNASMVTDDDGAPLHFIAQVEDLTERKSLEAQLREEASRFRLSFDQAPIGKALVAADGSWIRVNSALCELLGYTQEELLTKHIDELTHPEDRQETRDLVHDVLAGRRTRYDVEKRYIRSDGQPVWCLLSASVIHGEDGRPMHFISQIQNIAERKTLEAQLRSAADIDALTGVLNRRGFDRALATSLSAAREGIESAAVLFLDLDGFKEVNDTHGHHVGDQVLRAVAAAIRARVRATDHVARFGGDEFAILLSRIGSRQAAVVADDIRQAVANAAVVVGSTEVRVRASIGLAIVDDNTTLTPAQILALADEAMYTTKRQHRARLLP